MAGFHSARSAAMAPLHWPTFAPSPTAFVTEVFGIPTAAEAVETDKGYQLLG